ncbi:MAG: ferritin-like domain-containing protein, partial [Alphaproteobacteria bacterium]
MANITKDAAYDAVAPDDFASMMQADRYNARSTAVDKIISATHDHFWDPLDPKYIDFSTPFDLENEYIMPPFLNLDLQTEIGERLTEKQKIRLVNASTHWG